MAKKTAKKKSVRRPAAKKKSVTRKKSVAKKKTTTKKKSVSKKTSSKKKSSDEHGSSSDLRAKLRARQGDWENAEAPSYGELPDGVYIVRIDKATVNESKGSGRLQVSYTLKVVEGEYQNRNFFKHDGIDNEQSIGFYKASIARLGFEAPENIDEIFDICEEMEGSFCQITAKTKTGSDDQERQNIYFNKPIDSDEVNLEDLDEVEDDDDDEDPADDPDYEGDEEEEVEEDEESEEEDESEEDEDEEEESEEEEEISYSKGDRVLVNIEGEDYPGTVKSVRLGKANVEFDDGDSGKYDFADLSPETEEDGDDDAEDDAGEEDGEEGSGDVTVNFEDGDLKLAHKKKIKAMAKKLELDPDDYDSLSELLGDIGEYHNVSGEFDDPDSLLEEING